MCLRIKDGYDIEIAKEDIITYKGINKHWNYWRPIIISQGLHFKYDTPIKPLKYCFTRKELFEEVIHLIKRHGQGFICPMICEGFHSKLKRSILTNTICVVPKGSEICQGIDDDIVSNQLIVFKNYFHYLVKYKLKNLFNHE